MTFNKRILLTYLQLNGWARAPSLFGHWSYFKSNQIKFIKAEGPVADSRGWRGGRPRYWLRSFFSKSRLFPCKRHTVRCVHLR